MGYTSTSCTSSLSGFSSHLQLCCIGESLYEINVDGGDDSALLRVDGGVRDTCTENAGGDVAVGTAVVGVLSAAVSGEGGLGGAGPGAGEPGVG